jgi:hypothetical protein
VAELKLWLCFLGLIAGVQHLLQDLALALDDPPLDLVAMVRLEEFSEYLAVGGETICEELAVGDDIGMRRELLINVDSVHIYGIIPLDLAATENVQQAAPEGVEARRRGLGAGGRQTVIDA